MTKTNKTNKMSMFLMIAALVGLAMAGPAMAASCVAFTYTVGGALPSTCTVDGGAVSFSSFVATGFTAGQQIDVAFLDGGALGTLSGVTFNFNPAISSGAPYAIGYTATAVGGKFVSVSDSATPGGAATYAYIGSGFVCPPTVAVCNQSVLPINVLLNMGSYTGVLRPSQTITEDFNTLADVSKTPEISSGLMLMMGLGFGAIGLARRSRSV